MRSSEVHHVYPTNREHVTDGLSCWCDPSYQAQCDDCDGNPDGCWKCDHGTVYLSRNEAEVTDEPFIIVHNDIAPDGEGNA